MQLFPQATWWTSRRVFREHEDAGPRVCNGADSAAAARAEARADRVGEHDLEGRRPVGLGALVLVEQVDEDGEGGLARLEGHVHTLVDLKAGR